MQWLIFSLANIVRSKRYKTEKEAKASAFDCFLDHAAERGMVNHDKLSRIDGTRFVFS